MPHSHHLPGDNISDLPSTCLSHIFHFLSPSDRNRCSLVCRSWLLIDAQFRHRLSLNAKSTLNSFIKPIFSRFDNVTKLSLKCDRTHDSISDKHLILISLRCPNLIRLKLRNCRKLTHFGIEGFTKNCNKLKKVSFGSCSFGAKGINAVVGNCWLLEELSVKRLTDENDNSTELIMIKPSVDTTCLKMISLKDMCNGECFEPLICGSKKLKTLRVVRCYGDWDKVLKSVGENVKGLVEVHLERVQVSDEGLKSCRGLEVFRLLKTPGCSNLGVMSVAESCRGLRKVHIDGWKSKWINDEGLVAVAKNCPDVQELVVISVDVTCVGLDVLCVKCRKLERLALCGSETVGDAEIACIAAKCVSLRKLCIKSCPVSDYGMEALAVGCPNLVKVKVKKCKGVTSAGVGWLMACRESLTVNVDATVVESRVGNAGGDSRVMAVGEDYSRQD